jgi:hypothetical protein
MIFFYFSGNSSATEQPYRLLHLDIHPDAVHTIEDALHLFSAPETLEGYRASVTGKVFSLLFVFLLHFKYITINDITYNFHKEYGLWI